jgi:hypothetical protein
MLSKSPVVNSNGPAVPVPEVAVTKFSSDHVAVGVVDLVVERRLERVRRAACAVRARHLGERERRLDEDRRRLVLDDLRVYVFPSTSTDVTVGNCVSVYTTGRAPRATDPRRRKPLRRRPPPSTSSSVPRGSRSSPQVSSPPDDGPSATRRAPLPACPSPELARDRPHLAVAKPVTPCPRSTPAT